MTVVLQIEGMSCSHCLNAVNRALGTVQGVQVKQVQMGRAELEATGPEAVAAATKAVEDEGYHASVVGQG